MAKDDSEDKAQSFLAGKLTTLSKVTQKASGESSKAEKETRKILSKQTRRLDLTVGILEQNLDAIRELAKSDAEAKELLMALESSQSTRLTDIGSKISSGQKVTSKEGKEFANIMKTMSSALEGFEGSLTTNLGFVTKHLSNISGNSDASMEDRRKSILQLQKIAGLDEVQNQLSEHQKKKMDELLAIDAKNLNFNKKDNTNLQKLLFDLADDTTDIKIQGTLDNLNRNLQESTVTADELADVLDKQVGDNGESINDVLKDGLKSEIGQGLMDAILPGFGSIFSLGKSAFTLGKSAFGMGKKALGGIGKGVAGAVKKGMGFLGKGGKGIGSLLGKVGGKGLLKGAGKLLGPIAAAAFAGLDFSEGFSDPNKIAGLKKGEKAGFGTKMQAGLSSVASGLTFGLVDPETVFKGIDESMDFLFGEDGLLPGADKMLRPIISKIGSMIDFEGIVNSFVGIFSGEGIMGKLSNLGKFLLKASPIGIITNMIGELTGGFDGLFGEEGFFAMVKNFFTDIMEKASNLDILTTISEGWDNMFSEDGPFSFIGNIIDKITNFDFSSILPDSVSSLLGLGDDDDDEKEEPEDGKSSGFFSGATELAGKAGGFFGSLFGDDDEPSVSAASASLGRSGAIAPDSALARAMASPSASKLDGASTILSQKQEIEEREARKQNAQSGAPVIIQQGGGNGGSKQGGSPVTAKSEVNDMKLSSLNLSLMD